MVKWSPDSKAFIISKFNENAVEVYKVEKKKDGWLQASKALTFPKVGFLIFFSNLHFYSYHLFQLNLPFLIIIQKIYYSFVDYGQISFPL